MMQLFKSLLGESNQSNRDCAAKKIAPNPKPKPRTAAASAGDYRAVSIEPCSHCRAATRELAGKRYLLREVPSLPLSGAAASSCTCKFRKHADRRDADRRLLGETETHRWFSGSDRRQHCSRRSRADRGQ
jgi:hypothetical protein